jgi:ribonucleoside-diphosphate reductase alpha chain
MKKIPSPENPSQETSRVISVRKRDGALQRFELSKIEAAISLAFQDVDRTPDDNLKDILSQVHQHVVNFVSANPEAQDVIGIESLQDIIEVCLMRHGRPDVAKAYITWRFERAQHRKGRQAPDIRAIADYIHPSKYAMFIPELHRRETYVETVNRREAMDLRRWPELADTIKAAFDAVRERKIAPSMRSLQFGGLAIELINNRLFNCCATHINRPRAFSEVMYNLLAGCGVGYSVQFHHVSQLPALGRPNDDDVIHHVISDDVYGWAAAVDALVNSYFRGGPYVEFAYHLIRKRGQPLRTSGGIAPGHLPLKRALDNVRNVLQDAVGRKLRPIECHHILCYLAEAVVSGGIRRSAMISLFSPDDGEMMSCKTKQGGFDPMNNRNMHLCMSNNSVVVVRGEVTREKFARIFAQTREFGEPGFVFVTDRDYVFNPCAEIGLNCQLRITAETKRLIKNWEKKTGLRAMVDSEGQPVNINPANDDQTGLRVPKIGEVFTGFGFCNLTTINGSTVSSAADFHERCRHASVIGTLQAAYTNFKYLPWVSSVIADREALLGVSITGIMCQPQVLLDPTTLDRGAEIVLDTNAYIADKIGIRTAARATTVKPEGTASLALSYNAACSPGIHGFWSRRFFRRINAGKNEPVAKWFAKHNPHMVEVKPDGDLSLVFPVEIASTAVTTEELNGVRFLEAVRLVHRHWVLPGTGREESSPGLTHNVSNTCPIVGQQSWTDAENYLWDHKDEFACVSFLDYDADTKYPYAPYEKVANEADEKLWNRLIEGYKTVDYTQLIEQRDGTDRMAEAACVGGQCSIV